MKTLSKSIFLSMTLLAMASCQHKKTSSSVSVTDPNLPASPVTTTPTTPPVVQQPLTPSYVCGSATFTSTTYSLGTINSQDGWFVDPAAHFEEGIVNLGVDACRGNGVWKINNTVSSLAFGNQPQSRELTLSSGESTVRDAGGGDTIETSFFIKTASSFADGTAFTMSFSPKRSIGTDRHNYLRFVNDDDADGGFQIYAIDGVNLDQTHQVAINISRAEWHHVRIVNTNPDTGSNDTVEVYLDGQLVSTHSTWEDWRTSLPSPTLSVAAVLFRISHQASSFGSFSAPQGMYIDDFTLESYNASTPNTIIEKYQTGFEL